MTNVKSKRNSLIELYRFLFAMWVVYIHHYFFVSMGDFFEAGRLAVDFFFMLTGLFLMSNIKKLSRGTFFNGMIKVAWSKISPLGMTLIISLIFQGIHYGFTYNGSGEALGYLWFITWIILVPIGIYIIYRLVRGSKYFYLILALFIAGSYVLLCTICPKWGLFRAIVSIGVGIFVSIIPKNKWRIGRVNVNAIIVCVLSIVIFFIAMYSRYISFVDHIFIFLLCPCLLYFTTCVSYNNQYLDYLGKLSFGIYAYQCVLRPFEDFNLIPHSESSLALFALLMVILAIDDCVCRIYKYLDKRNRLRFVYIKKYN